jgi:hypothetical protein
MPAWDISATSNVTTAGTSSGGNATKKVVDNLNKISKIKTSTRGFGKTEKGKYGTYLTNPKEGNWNAQAAKINALKNKQIVTETIYSKKLKDITKGTFMFQMAMLGVTFSLQGLIGKFTGIWGEALSGVSDIEKNALGGILAQTFGGMDTGVSIDQMIKNSFNAQAIMGAMSGIFEQIFGNMINDSNMQKVKETFETFRNFLNDPAIKTSMKQIFSDTLQAVKDLVPLAEKLVPILSGITSSGILKYMILLYAAAVLLQPVFAVLQLILMLIASGVSVAAMTAFATSIIAIGTVAILVGGVLINAANEYAQSGNLIQAVIYGFVDTFSAFIDSMGAMLTVLLGGSGQFKYVQGSLENLVKRGNMGTYGTVGSSNNLDSYNSSVNKAVGDTYNLNFNRTVSDTDATRYADLIKQSKANGFS